MTRKRKRLTAIEKAAIVRRHLVDHVPIADLAEEHGIAPSQYYRWQNQLFSNLPGLFERKSDAARAPLMGSPTIMLLEGEHRYARESRILMDFFDTLGDYGALRPEAARISEGPGVHRVNLASSKEAVIYLHMGKAGETCAAGASLLMEELPMATGQVSVRFLHPLSGAQTQQEGKIQDGRLAVSLPAFLEDLAIHVTFR